MIATIKRWYALDQFETEEDKRIGRILLSMIHVFWLAGAVGLLINFVWQDSRLTVTLITGCILQLIPVWLLSKQRLFASNMFAVGIYICVTTIAATVGQGIHDYVIIMYPVAIMFSGLTHQRLGLYISTLLTLISIIWLAIEGTYEWFPVYQSHIPNWTDFFVADVLIILAAIAVYQSITIAEHSLNRLSQELVERKKAEKSLSGRNEVLKALNQVSLALIERREINDLFKILLMKIGELVNTPYVSIDLIEGEDILVTYAVTPGQPLQKGDRTKHGEDGFLSWRAIDTKQPVTLEDYNIWPKRRALFDDFPTHAVLVIPIIREEKAIGAINFIRTEVNSPFTAEDMEIAQQLVHMTALKLDDEYIYNQLQVELAERKQAQMALLKTQHNLQALIENSDGSIWSIDTQYRLITGNSLYRMHVNSIIGRDLLEGENILKIDYPKDILDKWKGYYDRALKGEKFSVETQTHYTSEPQEMEYHLSPIHTEAGDIVGVTVFGRNITERKRMENALLQSEQRFKSYVQNAPNVITIIDQDNHILYLNRTESGLPESIFIGHDLFDFISAEFHKTALDTLRQVRETGQPNSYITSSMIDGNESWYENHAMVLESANPSSDTIIISTNITKRKQDADALNAIGKRFHELVRSAPDAIIGVEKDGRIIFANTETSNLFGYTLDELTKLNVENLIPSQIREKHISLRTEYYEHPKTRRMGQGRELTALHKNGAEIAVDINLGYIHTEQGLQAIAFIRDTSESRKIKKTLQDLNEQLQTRVSEIEILQSELREQAIHDPLTGLYNRRYMQEAFKREFARSVREQHSLSIIMIDMDDLKVFNDTYGHQVGDRAIQTLTAQLKSMIRREDVACRYGGDEFIILMDKTTAEEAVKRIEEWRTALQVNPMQIDENNKIQIKFTAGVASFPAHEVSLEDVINYSDVALYRAKAHGRNCTVIFE